MSCRRYIATQMEDNIVNKAHMNKKKKNKFPSRAPKQLRAVVPFKFNEDGTIWVSDWLANKVCRFVPQARKLSRASADFKNVCVNWFRKEQKLRKEYLATRVPRSPTGLVFMSECLDEAFGETMVFV